MTKKYTFQFLNITENGDRVDNYLCHISDLVQQEFDKDTIFTSVIDKIKIKRDSLEHHEAIDEFINYQDVDVLNMKCCELGHLDEGYISFNFRVKD